MKIRALIPGTFDPVTIGHSDMIRRAAALFDEVMVVAFQNVYKSGSFFTAEQRLDMLRLACEPFENVTAALALDLLVDYVVQNEIDVVVKGVRSSSDYEYEYTLSLINRSFEERCETVFLPSRAEYQHISSTVVKELIRYGRPVDGYVPDTVARYIEQSGCMKTERK